MFLLIVLHRPKSYEGRRKIYVGRKKSYEARRNSYVRRRIFCKGMANVFRGRGDVKSIIVCHKNGGVVLGQPDRKTDFCGVGQYLCCCLCRIGIFCVNLWTKWCAGSGLCVP